MNICIFPGTFNPIHIAHVSMANFAIKEYGFDKIIFVPSYIPPHKNVNPALSNHRFNMVQLVAKTNPKFEVSDVEYLSEGKSYTIITVKKFIEQYKIKGRLNLIIGTDAFKNIKTWYKAEELKKLVHFIVFPRGEDIINKEEFEGYSYAIVDAEKIDISSTELRTMHKGETTSEVKDYILKNGLYN